MWDSINDQYLDDMHEFGFVDLLECEAIASSAKMKVFPRGVQAARDAIAMCIKYGFPVDCEY